MSFYGGGDYEDEFGECIFVLCEEGGEEGEIGEGGRGMGRDRGMGRKGGRTGGRGERGRTEERGGMESLLLSYFSTTALC